MARTAKHKNFTTYMKIYYPNQINSFGAVQLLQKNDKNNSGSSLRTWPHVDPTLCENSVQIQLIVLLLLAQTNRQTETITISSTLLFGR